MMFDRLVEKELVKIEREREIDARREEGFSAYLYPYY